MCKDYFLIKLKIPIHIEWEVENLICFSAEQDEKNKVNIKLPLEGDPLGEIALSWISFFN